MQAQLLRAGKGTAKEKMEALEKAGAKVIGNPALVGEEIAKMHKKEEEVIVSVD